MAFFHYIAWFTSPHLYLASMFSIVGSTLYQVLALVIPWLRIQKSWFDTDQWREITAACWLVRESSPCGHKKNISAATLKSCTLFCKKKVVCKAVPNTLEPWNMFYTKRKTWLFQSESKSMLNKRRVPKSCFIFSPLTKGEHCSTKLLCTPLIYKHSLIFYFVNTHLTHHIIWVIIWSCLYTVV